jgi:GntR family phosphonate transport system transcriptional regulator
MTQVDLPKQDPDGETPRVVAPVWRRIADELTEAIARGEYNVGDALPTALALSQRYSVHRHTVRQAFRHLQDLGLVSVEQGRGTFVTAARFPYVIGRRTRLSESFRAAGLAIETRLLSAVVVEAPSLVCSMLKLPPRTPIWRVRRLGLTQSSSISVTSVSLSAERFPDFDQALARNNAAITATLRSFGIHDYVRLWTRISARRVDPQEQAELGLAADDVVLVSRALDGTPDGAPLSYVETSLVAARLELVVEG